MKLSGKVRFIFAVVSAVVLVLAAASLRWPKLATPARTAVVHADGGCSLASLNGPYAFERQGTNVALLGASFPNPPFPFGEVGIVTFDGAGNFSGKSTVNLGGVVLTPTFAGTYTVNNDCTGTNTVTTNVGVTLHNAFVLSGQRWIETQTDAWAVVQGRGQKQGD